MLSGGEGGEVGPISEAITSAVPGPMVGIAVRSTPIIPRNARAWMPSLPVSLLAAFAERLDAVSEVVPGAGSGAPPSGGSSEALDLGHHPGLAVVDLLGQEVGCMACSRANRCSRVP